MRLSSGTIVGPYEIVSLVGAGGMGEVYRAQDSRLNRAVAIKIISAAFSTNTERLRRFEQEARAVGQINHPNILTIHDIGSFEGATYLITELLEGETLRQRLKTSPIPWSKSVEYAWQIAEGLAAAHEKGIVHRDLKPENIFITKDDRVKILDFGLAKLLDKPESQETKSEAPTTPPVTQDGGVVGTVNYMSPEQIRGEKLDGRSDIFALGCVMHEMLTGKLAFARSAPLETIAAILRDDPATLDESDIKAPLKLQMLINHCLKKNLTERYQSARDLAYDLKTMLSGGEIPLFTRAKKSSFHSTVWIPALILLLIAAASLYLLTGRAKSIHSIAVLPFVNTSKDPNSQYLSDGITESIINNLSQLTQMRVMARGTVYKYEGQQIAPQKIGKDLHVNSVLTGSVLEQDGTLIVRTELANTEDGTVIWGDQYKLKGSDILSVQEEISKEITEKLRLKLSGQEEQRLAKHYTDSAEAYRLYLKGLFFLNKRTADGFSKAIDFFKQAIESDPNYALAYAGLADCYALQGDYYILPPGEAFPKAKAAATKALEIDEQLGEAHTSLGHVKVYYWDWNGAEQEYKRAIQLKPSYATAHHWYANYLMIMGRTSEALSEIRQARDLDPLSSSINSGVGWHLYLARQYDEAIPQFQETIKLDSSFAPAHSALGRVYVEKKMYDEGIIEIQKAITLSGGLIDYISDLGYAYAASGKTEDAEKIVAQLQERSKKDYISPVSFAMIFAALGKKDQAFEMLNKAYNERSEYIAFLKAEPGLDKLRLDPRFGELVARLGLPRQGL